MITPEIEARILRFYRVEKWKVGTIARELGLHHSVVRRVLAKSGEREVLRVTRPSIVDPYRALIVETLERHPRLSAQRLYEMMRARGYQGGPDHFRHIVARLRPRPPAEAYLRLETLPGEQAQVDWGHFGSLRIGRAERPLMAFVMVLSWSRRVFLRFYLNQRLENFLRGHEAAFESFGGVPRVCLYDNLKSVVLERVGEAIRYHPDFLAFAGDYGFEPRPVAVARGNEKGRVERAIRYIRDSFFAARRVRTLDELNAQAEEWANRTADARKCPSDRTLSVGEAFTLEQPKLLSLPETRSATDERIDVRVRKTPYVRFDLNDYSVPHDHVWRTLTIVATPTTVRIFDGTEKVAEHPRSYDRDQQIERPEHVAALVELKRQSRKHRAIDRLRHEAPASAELLVQLSERGANLGSATAALMRLIDQYGPTELESAIGEALERGSPSPHSVRHVLERRRREQGSPPRVGVTLPEELRDVSVQPPSLDIFDPKPEEDDDTNEDSH